MHLSFLNIFLIISSLTLIIFNNYFSRKINIYDIPDNKRKIHLKPISKIGGIIIFPISINFIIEVAEKFNYEDSRILLILMIFLILYVLHFLDDCFELSSYTRLLGSLIAIYFLFELKAIDEVTNLNFISLKMTFELYGSSIFFSCLCVLLLINTCNLADGANGILISLFIFWVMLIFQNDLNLNIIINIILILCIFFLNLKNKLFLGNSGSLVIGFVTSILIIIFYNEKKTIYSVEQIFIYLMIPGVDMFRVFLSRILNAKNPFHADQNHLHHLLLKKNNNKNILFSYLFICFTPTFFYLFINKKFSLYLILFFLTMYILLVYYLKQNEIKKKSSVK